MTRLIIITTQQATLWFVFVSLSLLALQATKAATETSYEIDGYSINPFDGRDYGKQFTGAWIDLRQVRLNGVTLKSKLGFEISSDYKRSNHFSLGVSSFRTFSPGSKAKWTENNHASLGDRYWMNFTNEPNSSDKRNARNFYNSLGVTDRQSFEVVCAVVSNSAFTAEVRQKMQQSARGTDLRYRNFWGQAQRRDQIDKLGELCSDATGKTDTSRSQLIVVGSRAYVSDGTSYTLKTSGPKKDSGVYACVQWDAEPDVKRVQLALKDMGYYFGPINGKIGYSCAGLRKYAEQHTKYPEKFTFAEMQELYGKVRTNPATPLKLETKFCGVSFGSVDTNLSKQLNDVRAIQAGLRAKGYLWGTIDGIAGAQTCKAFMNYIASEGERGVLGASKLNLLAMTGIEYLEKKKIESISPAAVAATMNDSVSTNLGKGNAASKSIEVTKRNSELATKTKSSTEHEQRLLGQINELKKINDTTENARLQLSNKLEQAERSRIQLQKSLADAKANVTRLEQTLRTYQNGGATHTEAINALNEQLSNAQIKATLANQDLSIEQKRSKALEKELLKARSQLAQVSSEKIAIEAELSQNKVGPDHEKTIADAKEQIQRLGKDNASLKVKLSQLEEELEAYRASERAKTDWIDELTPEWSARLGDMPVQQRQFCNIANEFRLDLEDARSSRNQIRINMTFQERQQSLDSLLPNGDFRDWIVRVISVGQMPDGSARFVAEMPCKSMIGSGVIGRGSDTSWVATIGHRSRMYRELAKVSAGDFIAVQGGLLEVEAFEPGQPESFYGVNQIGDNPHPEVKALGLEGELFISRIDYLIMLRQ